MLREDVDKFLVCTLHKNTPFISCILCQVLHAINSDPRKTMLGKLVVVVCIGRRALADTPLNPSY